MMKNWTGRIHVHHEGKSCPKTFFLALFVDQPVIHPTDHLVTSGISLFPHGLIPQEYLNLPPIRNMDEISRDGFFRIKYAPRKSRHKHGRLPIEPSYASQVP